MTYLRIILRRWPVALLAIVVTTAVTASYVGRQPSVYESKATYVIRPRSVDVGQGLRAMDTLVRGVEINSTYASIARSQRIKDRAQASLGNPSLPPLTVTSETVTGTNVLQIVVAGSDPQAARDLAEAVGVETVAYVSELQDLYELAPLDAANVPTKPVRPNRPLLMVTGLVFGIGLGAILAIIADGVLGRMAARVPQPVQGRFRTRRDDEDAGVEPGHMTSSDAV